MIDLDNITKEEHYQVPDGYFDEFPKQVMYSIRKENAKRRNIWLTSIAAVMALVICSATILRIMHNNEKEQEHKIFRENTEDSQPMGFRRKGFSCASPGAEGRSGGLLEGSIFKGGDGSF